MNRIRATGISLKINPSAPMGVLGQIEDQIRSLQSDIIQIASEYNAQVYPVLASLPQGGADPRWRLQKDFSPRVRGLDGASLFVDSSASAVIDGGQYWDSINLRPKTIKESLSSLRVDLNSLSESLRRDLGGTSSGLDPATSALIDSLHSLAQENEANILQLAKDIYDETFFSLDGDGDPNLDIYSVRDMLHAVLAIHGGGWNSSIALGHSGIEMTRAYYGTFVAGTNEETALTLELVVGGIVFDPAAFGHVIADIDIYFEGLINYVAAGAAGSGSLLLYDMGAPGSVAGAGVLRSTLSRSHLDGNAMDRERNLLTTAAVPGVDADEIHETARVYEIRIAADGLGDPTDVFRLSWGGISIVPNA